MNDRIDPKTLRVKGCLRPSAHGLSFRPRDQKRPTATVHEARETEL
jgi:hypothetical protein